MAARQPHGPAAGGRISLVLGGARSGKSTFAETLMAAYPTPWYYVATAEALDDEMRERIRHHRDRRDGRWVTVEAPTDLASPLSTCAGPMLVDCLTMWLSNLMLSDLVLETHGSALERALSARLHPTVLVSNEVGYGIVPENPLARRFRDEAGRLNQRIARLAHDVTLVVAGLPVIVKAAP